MKKKLNDSVAKRIHLDEGLAVRVSDYRFRAKVRSETQAFRDLLQVGLKEARNLLVRSPGELVTGAMNRLKAARLNRTVPEQYI